MFSVTVNYVETRTIDQNLHQLILETKCPGVPQSPMYALILLLKHGDSADFSNLPEMEKVDLDVYKLSMIDYEFKMFICQIIIRVIHFFTLIYIRGMNFNLFDLLFLGKATMSSLNKMLTDLVQFFEFKAFVQHIQTNLQIKEYRLTDKEICPIC
jgi:hypothetical protein